MALDPDGVALGHYRIHHADVRLTCRDCKHHRDLPLEAVIARLERRDLGGSSTGVRAVAGFIAEPCPACGGRRFETTPAFPSGAAKA